MPPSDPPDTADQEAVRRAAESLDHDDVLKVGEKAEHIRKAVVREGPLGRFVDDIELMLELVTDYLAGRYRDVSHRTVAAASFALLYVFAPIDAVPDAIPFVGQLDDATVVGAALAFVAKELATYKRWRDGQKAARGKAPRRG